ncbi:MAG: STAS domain-containing protein [Magnetococcales bacterium]|nr:STAS domain-containing protein [Magnetococcales bacterium]
MNCGLEIWGKDVDNSEAKKGVFEQDLSKMTQAELIEQIEKDFNRLWLEHIEKNPKAIFPEASLEESNDKPNHSPEPMAGDRCDSFISEGKLTIKVTGRCSYETWKKSKNLIKNEKIDACEVDFSQADNIDSIGIGSLLALKNGLGKGVKIVLSNTNESILRVLQSSHLDRLFTFV